MKNTQKTLSIHQPTFFPWMGLFDKINRSNLYYVFDHVAVSSGKGWHSRSKILNNGKEQWLTIPIQKSGKSGQTYKDIEITNNKTFIRKHLGTLRQAYVKAPFFQQIYKDIEVLYNRMSIGLVDFNIDCLELFCNRLNIDLDYIKTCTLIEDNPNLDLESGNELVLSLAKISGCPNYLSGNGCLDFIDPESFKNCNINFYFQDFVHPVYPQLGSKDFVPGLSIIDAAMNLGWEGVGELLNTSQY
jgi:hypothetical protein